MLTETHSVQRPQWTYVIDGDNWPCGPARKMTAEAYAGDPDGMVAYLARLMDQAAVDLGLDNPTRLYRRFIAWTLPDDQACRLCGKAGHDATPGMPPRLIPCEMAKYLKPDP